MCASGIDSPLKVEPRHAATSAVIPGLFVFKRRAQISVSGRNHTNIVLALYGHHYEVDGQSNVDSLSLGFRAWPVIWISKGPTLDYNALLIVRGVA